MKKAFTLIELLVVIAIVGILAVLGVVSFNKFTESSKIAATKENHNNIFYNRKNLTKRPLS